MSTTISRQNSCFRCFAITIGWAVDEAWPVVRDTTKKVYTTVFDTLNATQKEIRGYAYSGLGETLKSAVFVGKCTIEVYHFPHGTIRKILVELGSYLASGTKELYKFSLVFQECSKTFASVLISDLIQPILQEASSYQNAGRSEIVSLVNEIKRETKLWLKCAVYHISPIALECFLYSQSGIKESVRGLRSSLQGIEETRSSLVVEGGKVAAEAVSYAASGARETAKAFAFIRESIKELTGLLNASILTELKSYMLSGYTEINKGVDSAHDAIEESWDLLEELNQTLSQELDEAILSGYSESAQTISKAVIQTQEYLQPYLKSVLREGIDYIRSGCYQTGQGIITTSDSLDDTLIAAKKPFNEISSEIQAYSFAFKEELKRSLFKTVPQSIQETFEACGNLPLAVILESFSYLKAFQIASLHTLRAVLQPLKETLVFPKETIEACLLELKSYLRSLIGEILALGILMKDDIPISLQHGIGDPLRELSWQFVIEYRGWRYQDGQQKTRPPLANS